MGQWALYILMGASWGWDQGTIPGGFSHSPAFANVQRERVIATSSQQHVCVLSFSLFASLDLSFELGLKCIFFLSLWHSRNKSKKKQLGKEMTALILLISEI